MEEKKSKKIYQKWWFWAIIVIIIAILANIPDNNQNNTIQVSNNNLENNTQNTIQTPKETEEEKQEREKKEAEEKAKKEKEEKENKAKEEKEFKASCKSYTYKEIARNPDKYIGKPIKITGKVIQVLEGWFNSVELRVDMTKDEYGYYDDTVYCTYTYTDGEDKILEDDIVTIYGICQGTTSYESVLGSTITLPKIEVKYLTIKE